MRRVRRIFGYFSLSEWLLWIVSTILIVVGFAVFDGRNGMALAASLVGACSLIFCAKANPIGQALMVVFSIMYGVLSYQKAYYGEMITYLGMTLPIAVMSFVSWVRHPFRGNRSQVAVGKLRRSEPFLMALITIAVTVGFYFILRALNTANLLPSTISVATSLIAAYLTIRRSPYYALGYAANDLVLIWLWALAVAEDRGYVSVLICFVIFFFNDLYGFLSWKKIAKKQRVQLS